MKILHIVRQFHPMIGGIENYVLSLSQEQQKQNDVTVLTLNRSFVDGKKYPAIDQIDAIKIIRIPYKGSYRYPLAFSVLKYLKSYDIIHIHCVDFFLDFLFLTKIFHRKKIVLTTHGGFFHTRKNSFIKKLFFNIVTRITIKGCSKVIACGDNDYDTFSKISTNVIKIDNGVNIKPYINSEKHIKPGTLIYVGRMDVHKRIDNLIHVVKAIKEKGQDVKLRIVGPDWSNQKPALQSLAMNLNIADHIIFDGAISNEQLIEAYQESQIFLSASEYEGFGLSAIEALSSGTVCVVHENDSFKRLFDKKDFALLSNFSDHKQTAEKILSIINSSENEYSILSNNARNYARQYSWEIVEKKIGKLY